MIGAAEGGGALAVEVIDAASPIDAASLVVVAGNPTPEELAAVTVVLELMLDELSHSAAMVPVRSAWQRSQRAVRTPLVPGAGAWRAF